MTSPEQPSARMTSLLCFLVLRCRFEPRLRSRTRRPARWSENLNSLLIHLTLTDRLLSLLLTLATLAHYLSPALSTVATRGSLSSVGPRSTHKVLAKPQALAQ